MYLRRKSRDKRRETMWSGKDNYAMVCGQVIAIVCAWYVTVCNQAGSVIGCI